MKFRVTDSYKINILHLVQWEYTENSNLICKVPVYEMLIHYLPLR